MTNEQGIDVRALAELSRMEVSDEELKKLEGELPEILAFVDTIRQADVSAIDRNPLICNVMREDGEPHASGLYSAKLLAEAPAVKGGRLVVKQVVTRRH